VLHADQEPVAERFAPRLELTGIEHNDEQSFRPPARGA
jgi:hypothetical protein